MRLLWGLRIYQRYVNVKTREGEKPTLDRPDYHLEWDCRSEPDKKWTEYIQIPGMSLELTTSDLEELMKQILSEQDFAEWTEAPNAKQRKEFLKKNITLESKCTFMAESRDIEPVVMNQSSKQRVKVLPCALFNKMKTGNLRQGFHRSIFTLAQGTGYQAMGDDQIFLLDDSTLSLVFTSMLRGWLEQHKGSDNADSLFLRQYLDAFQPEGKTPTASRGMPSTAQRTPQEPAQRSEKPLSPRMCTTTNAQTERRSTAPPATQTGQNLKTRPEKGSLKSLHETEEKTDSSLKGPENPSTGQSTEQNSSSVSSGSLNSAGDTNNATTEQNSASSSSSTSSGTGATINVATEVDTNAHVEDQPSGYESPPSSPEFPSEATNRQLNFAQEDQEFTRGEGLG
jgi:hypothetical protein